jgi:hypothetical protein
MGDHVTAKLARKASTSQSIMKKEHLDSNSNNNCELINIPLHSQLAEPHGSCESLPPRQIYVNRRAKQSLSAWSCPLELLEPITASMGMS